MIMPPTDNRTPLVVQTFTDITITLEDGGPDRWASGDLGTNFSDPDGDQLIYSVGSSNESVAGAVISEPGPIVIVQAQGGGTATITVTATEPGGITATQSFRVTVNDRPDHSNTPADATAIALNENIQGRIDSPNDVDYFRLRVDVPGTLTIRTTGNADPDIAVFDGAGNEVPGVSGSWIGSITQDILDRGDLLVRFSGGNAGGEYTANTTLDQLSQTSPDPSVGSPTVSDSSPETGAAFTLSATVSNDGDGAAAATTLRYYRSTDATITTSDTSVGADAVAGLAALGSSAESISLTAPSTAGTYYYGACVDAVAGESNTANNCSRSVTVTVTAPAPQPDLLVSASVDDSNLNTGDSFTLSATVSNAGDEQSAASTLRYYRSTDSTISSSDTQVGTDAVGALAASGTSAGSISLTTPSTAGAYYYGACVDTVTDESDTTNNCSSSVTIAVEEESSGQPDLRIVGLIAFSCRTRRWINRVHPYWRRFSWNSHPILSIRSKLWRREFGRHDAAILPLNGPAPRTTATISVSDTEVGTDEVSALVPSTQVSEGIDLTAPSSAGTYYYGACVDASVRNYGDANSDATTLVTDESDTTNNCSGSVAVTVSEPQTSPDLSVGSPTVSDSGPETGAAFTLSATVSNDGDGAAAATTLRYYRSTDATITTSDTSVGTDAVAGLAALGSSAESISLTAPSTAGTYYYGACVDTVTGESDTTNNCSSSVTVTVAEPQTSPDLSVGSPTVSDSGPETGTAFTLSATVSNDGDGAAAATTLRYYRSADATISSSDTQVGTDAVGALAAGGTSDESVALTAPSTAGTYYYGACVDAVTGESSTTNNCSSSVTVTVTEPEPQPDLVVGSASVDDSNLNTGDSFTLSATVSNAGDEQSAASTLRYYRSTDSTISSSDTSVGTDAVGALAASGTSAESISLTAPSTAGTYYYGACVDAVTDESDTTNNCSSSVTIAVEEESSGQPDLRIVGVSVVTPLDGVSPGTLLQFSASVRNYGDANSDATTLRYYRSTDATISVSDTEVGTDEVSALVPSTQALGSSAESISLTRAVDRLAPYYYGACVDTVTGESDTTNNCSSSVTVTVAAPQTSPDLSVGSPTVSDSGPETSTAFTLSATVSNDGDGASAATTLRYYRSADATISSSDTQVGTDAVGALAAGGTSDESVALTAPSTAGTYYYGACVDAVTGESSTTNNCSSSVTVTVTEPEPQPDLVVGSASVDDSNLNTGDSFHAVGDGEQRGRRAICGVDAAVLPIDRFDDLFVGHVGRHGRGGGIGRLGDERRVDLADRTVDGWHLLLWGVRGRGDRRVGHHEQLLVVGDNRCGGGVIRAAGLEDRWGKRGHPS